MKTYLDCIPCFFRQTLESSRLAKLSKKQQKKVIDNFCQILPKLSLSISPPEMAMSIYKIINKATSNKDPYKNIKRKSNLLALKLEHKLMHKVDNSRNRILTALELAIAGNIIDFGVKNSLNINHELKRILQQESKMLQKNKGGLFNYSIFIKDLKRAKKILYIADNAGEIVFDKILLREIKRNYPEKHITFVVRGKAVINDCLKEDAYQCGINEYADIISSGLAAPGTIIRLCSKKFRKAYAQADMIISKGQGNFESLLQEKKSIYFLFMAKCQVVARHIKCKLGDIILFHNKGKK